MPHVVCRLDIKMKFPHVLHYRGKGPSFPDTEVKNSEEMIVYLIAHELRHLFQAKAKNKRGYYKGSKGRYSEYDAEMYAIDMLEKWRAYKIS